MLASSRKPCHAAMPQAAAKSPALHCGRDRAATDERPLSVKHAGGPMRSSAPAQGRAAACHPGGAACLPYLAGRAFTPAGKVCAGPEGYWQGRAPHPSVCAVRRIHLPLQGRLCRPFALHCRAGSPRPPGRAAPAQPLRACAGTAHPPCDTAMQGGCERAARNRQPSAGSGALPAEFSLPGPFRILPA